MMRQNLRDFLRRAWTVQSYVAVALAVVLAVGPLTPQVQARTKKGDKLLKDAQAAEAREDWDRAAELYSQAVDEDPKDAAYLIGMRRARSASALQHVQMGRDFRSNGKMAEAIAEFQKAILTDPSLSIALQELKQTQEMLANPGKDDEANLTPYQRALKDSEDRAESLMGVPTLRPTMDRLQELHMNGQPVNVIYNTVAAIGGLNVVWDSTWNRPTRPFDIDIPDGMSLLQALDFIATVTRTFWKPLTPTTIFVTEESANKRRDFTDQVTKVLFVTNAATAQEFNEIQTAVRTITDIRRVYPYVAQKAIVVRGDVDAVALAEKLVRDLDKPKAEVVVDVLIMEANSARTRDLAATLAAMTSSGLSPGLQQSAIFSPRAGIAVGGTAGTGNTPATAGTSVRLSNLGRLSTGDWTTTLPGALLQAMVSDTRTKILQSPQLRASDGQQARLAVGDQVPIASGNFQTGVTGTTGVGVNTTFQYRDVGVIVTITPTVHSTSEVTLHLELELSNVKNYVDVGNISQPVIGQNKSTADIRMREGEVSILAGLTRQQGSDIVNGFPGLVDIPVLGKVLFGSNRVERDQGELMIALVPHIVRTPDYSPSNLQGVFSGTDQLLTLRYLAGTDEAAQEPQGSAPAPGVAAPPAAAAPKPAQGGVRVAFDPAQVTANANAPFTVNIQLENATDATAANPLRITWDPAMMRLNDISAGEFLSRDGGRVTSVKDIRNGEGQATLTITRAGGSPGVSGTGTLATLTFVALSPGSSRVTVSELGLRNSQNGTPEVALGSVAVTVR